MAAFVTSCCQPSSPNWIVFYQAAQGGVLTAWLWARMLGGQTFRQNHDWVEK